MAFHQLPFKTTQEELVVVCKRVFASFVMIKHGWSQVVNWKVSVFIFLLTDAVMKLEVKGSNFTKADLYFWLWFIIQKLVRPAQQRGKRSNYRHNYISVAGYRLHKRHRTTFLTLLQLRTFRPSVCVAPFRFHLGLNEVHLQTSRCNC